MVVLFYGTSVVSDDHNGFVSFELAIVGIFLISFLDPVLILMTRVNDQETGFSNVSHKS